jgi:hypothetical protein
MVDGVIRQARRFRTADRLVTRVARVWYDLPVPPLHYYSPLPNIQDVERNRKRWYLDTGCPGIDWRETEQITLCQELASFAGEFPDLPDFSSLWAEGWGEGYGEVESYFLHCMVRHLKPKRIVEIGSGISTRCALHALDANRQADGADGEMICIEPYPKPKLRDLARDRQITLHDKPVQEVALDVFATLGANDILFVDSSHSAKVDSDVHRIYFEILPALRNGVVIHVHDIPFPYLAVPPEHFMHRMSMLWNEAPLVRAFLMYNEAFSILLCQSYLHHRRPEVIQALVPPYDKAKFFPSSLWLRKNEELSI